MQAAVELALRAGATTRDAVAQFLWEPEPWSATLFQLDGHPHLRHVRVAGVDLNQYRSLLCVEGAA